jgi:PAS domain S-box-containing protein
MVEPPTDPPVGPPKKDTVSGDPGDVADAPYRQLVESITDYAICGLDTHGVVTSWNTGAQRLEGYQPDEIIGQSFARFYTPEDQAARRPQDNLAAAELDGRLETEGWRVRKDGSRFWAHVVIDPIRAESGQLVGFAKITRDQTERREDEQTLHAAQEQFGLLVQSVSEFAIFMLDRQGRVTNWNLGAERIKGYRPDEVIGQSFSRFYTEEDRAAGVPMANLTTALRDGRLNVEGWRVRKSGARFWANVTIEPIRDASGETLGFAKITRDVTDRRASEQALEHARENLSQSRKLEAIGQLASGIAHDFNNLLMAILGSLDFVQSRMAEGPQVTKFLDNAMQSARRGTTLTRRLLAFARRQALKREAVDLNELIPGLIGLIQGTFDPSVIVDVRIPGDLPPVDTDAGQLESSLLNLALNARDAMPKGGVLTIEAKPATHRGGDDLAVGCYVRIRVTDTGEGMDPETLARAVEPFFTTRGPGKGAGLGLSMAHGLAMQSGGKLGIISHKGAGTTVELWLPVARVAAEPADAPNALEDDTAQPHPLIILAVDDDPLVLFNTVAMLQDQGHMVLSASSGREALLVLDSADHVDLVMSDHAMPHMTGVQLAKVLATRRPGLPVMLASGYAELPPKADPRLLKLTKPFDQMELARAIATTMHPTGTP